MPVCAGIGSVLIDEDARMYTGGDDLTIRVWDVTVSHALFTESDVSVYYSDLNSGPCISTLTECGGRHVCKSIVIKRSCFTWFHETV